MPPTLRAGQLAEIEQLNALGSTVKVSFTPGSTWYAVAAALTA